MAAPILNPKPGKRPPGRSTSPPPRGSGGGLMSTRIAGVPAPVLIGGVVVAVAIGLYLRSRSSAATTAATTAAPALADTGTTGGASSSGADPNAGAYQNFADAINGLTGILGGGGTFQLGGGPPPAAPAATSGTSTATPPAGTFIDPVTGTTINSAGLPTNTSYADLGVTPAPVVGAPLSLTYITGPGAQAPLATVTRPQSIPAPPHNAATLVHPAQSAAKPVSGYSAKSNANLH